MNCESNRTELEDYIYGELAEPRAAEVRKHLAGCRECAALRDELERENEVYAQFYEQTSFEPSGEMWEAIRSRIQAEPAPRKSPAGESGGGIAGFFQWMMRPAVLRQAAFAAVLIAITVGVTTYVVKRGPDSGSKLASNGEKPAVAPSPEAGPAPSMTPQPVETPRAEIASIGQKPPANVRPEIRKVQVPAKAISEQDLLVQQIARAEREYRNAIRMLDTAIAKRKDGFDPAVFQQYQSSLALIDNSIAESKRALRERPGDPAAGQFLLAAYAKKMELMQDIAMR